MKIRARKKMGMTDGQKDGTKGMKNMGKTGGKWDENKGKKKWAICVGMMGRVGKG